jgi:hypothetical protein
MEWKVLEQFKLVPNEPIFINLTPDEVTLLFYVLGLAIAQSLTIDEVNLLANGLFETAQVLFVIASQRTLINDFIDAQSGTKSTIELELEIKKLQDKIEHLQEQINTLKN